MKSNLLLKSIARMACTLALVPMASCENGLFQESCDGAIILHFESENYIATRASHDNMPDTNSFLLTVTGSKGNVIYSGAYGNAPESIMVGAGSYTVEVISHKFSAPKFDEPQYGDIQVVNVREGTPSRVSLLCTRQNAGIRLEIASDFLTSYPKGILYLKSSEGRLMYSYSEKRYAYFLPGNVSLVLSDDGVEQTLLTRNLSARDMLQICLTVAKTSPTVKEEGGISIQVDTSGHYFNENFEIGGSSGEKGAGKESAMGVVEAKKNIGKQGVWVYGYIVGGDLTSSSASFEKPFSSNTNLCLASKSSVRTKDSCMSIQLQKGVVRNALNLVDHPDYLHHILYVKGDIVESYFGIPGVQNITDWSLTD